MLRHRLPQPTGLVTESRICTSECHLMHICLAACGCTQKQYARGEQNLAQLPRRDAEAGSYVQRNGFFFPRGLKFSGSLAQRQDTAVQLTGGTVPLSGAASPSHCWEVVGATPALGKGKACPVSVLCCACFDYSLLCSSDME